MSTKKLFFIVNWNEQDLKDLAGNFTDVAPYVLEYQQVLNDKENFTKRIIDHYFQGNISANIKVNITKVNKNFDYFPLIKFNLFKFLLTNEYYNEVNYIISI